MYMQFAMQFMAVWLLQVSTPGPNFVRISHSALENSRIAAFAVAAGSALGNMMWCGLAALGAAVAANSGGIGAMLRVVGAVYLCWLGCGFIRRALSPPSEGTVGCSDDGPTIGNSVRTGVMTSLANPQTALFFATYFLMSGSKLSAVELWLIGSPIVAVTTLIWYAIVIAILTHPRTRQKYLTIRRPLDFAFGALLLFAATKLISAVSVW